MELELVEAMVKKHQRDKKITRVISMNAEPAVPKGDNYCSEIHRAKLDVVLGSGKKTTKSVIIKLLPELEVHRKFLTEKCVFKKEINMYTNTLQHMESIMEDYNDPEDKLWCEMIGHRRYDMIILEDLKEQNFHVASRRDMLDLEHALIAVKGLARFHAMSKVILSLSYISKEDFSPYFFCEDEVTIKMAFINSMEVLAEVIESDWGPEWKKFAERLSAASDSTTDKMLSLGKVDESRFNVINHGDCWTNNMMFKYDSKKKPISMRFIDFPMSNYHTFAQDFIYVLYDAVRPKVRRSYFKELVDAYYDSLRETLKKYNYPEEKILSRDQAEEEIKNYKFFGFGLLCTVLSTDTADAADAMEYSLADISSRKDTEKKLYRTERYKQFVQEDFLEFYEMGYI